VKGDTEMKRSFQVATVFTGAVACTTALAPMAEAGTATATVVPDTTARNCTTTLASSWTAVHLYYSAKANHPIPGCIKGAGYISFPGGKKFAGICGGAWSGIYYWGVPGTSLSGSSYFNPSYLETTWRQTDLIYGVDLVGWHYLQGETSCPY
jgi:hypothetical protein